MSKPSLSLLAVLSLSSASVAQAQAPGELRGEQVVKLQCVKCHETGLNGAPRIGDRDAWIPRLRDGVDRLVLSAIRGHGNMPSRGGMPQFTDPEIRAAVLYMFNGRDAPSATAAAAQAAPARDPHRKVIEGIEIDLGIVPKATGLYHVNVSLQDAATSKPVKNATVEARVASPLAGQTKRLEPAEVNGMLGYGNDFRMSGNDPYTITVSIRMGSRPQPIETSFDYRR